MSEICYECGRSVSIGSGRFVNRIPSLDDYKDRVKSGVAYPEGEWLCAECDDAAQRGDGQYFDKFRHAKPIEEVDNEPDNQEFNKTHTHKEILEARQAVKDCS